MAAVKLGNMTFDATTGLPVYGNAQQAATNISRAPSTGGYTSFNTAAGWDPSTWGQPTATTGFVGPTSTTMPTTYSVGGVKYDVGTGPYPTAGAGAIFDSWTGSTSITQGPGVGTITDSPVIGSNPGITSGPVTVPAVGNTSVDNPGYGNDSGNTGGQVYPDPDDSPYVDIAVGESEALQTLINSIAGSLSSGDDATQEALMSAILAGTTGTGTSGTGSITSADLITNPPYSEMQTQAQQDLAIAQMAKIANEMNAETANAYGAAGLFNAAPTQAAQTAELYGQLPQTLWDIANENSTANADWLLNVANLGLGEGQLGVEQGNLGVNQGNLALNTYSALDPTAEAQSWLALLTQLGALSV